MRYGGGGGPDAPTQNTVAAPAAPVVAEPVKEKEIFDLKQN